MDRTEEDMKNKGFFSIFKHSIKTIITHNKIFTQITLSLILPLTIIFLAHMEISNHVFNRSDNSYSPYNSSNRHESVTYYLFYWLFKVLYFTIVTIFSLLSTAAIVFTIASIYTGRDVTFRQVIKIVPRIWKRLLVTFVFIYLALFIYNVISGIAFVIIGAVSNRSYIGVLFMLILLILYVIGFLYLSMIWQLASVVTVLENLKGIKAMKKGKTLAYGKKKVGMAIAFVLYAIMLGLVIVYYKFVEYGDLLMIWRVLIGVLIGIVVMILFLLFIVTQKVLYLVCKSFHREAIDKVSLSTFLAAYMTETVVLPKSGEEIQLGRAQAPPVSQEV